MLTLQVYTLFYTYLDYILAKFEPNSIVQNVQNLSFWISNASSFMPIFDKALTPFCKMFPLLKPLFDGKLLIFRLPFFGFQKIMVIQHM